MEKFKELEAIVKKAVREALEEAGSEEARRIAEALDKLVAYTFTGFNKILEVLEKHSKILEEHTKILEEHSKILEEHSKILEKHSKILEEHSKILEKHSKILEEHTKILTRIEATLGGLTSRMGIDMERMILNVYKDVFEREGLEIRKVEKISFKDVDGRYYRRGAKLELDIYAHDNKVYFMEVKSLVDVNDVEWFNFKCEIFEKILGRRPDRRMIVCINILDEALERARELGVDIIYGRVIKAEES
jgi:hypothetical protein